MEKHSGIITIQSKHSVKETADRLENVLHQKGVTVFARIDQKAEAEKAALTMQPMELLIFGNPKAGTPLMVADPLSGLDLPLKVLIWQDNNNKVWLTYNDFNYLAERCILPAAQVQALSGIEKIIRDAGAEIIN